MNGDFTKFKNIYLVHRLPLSQARFSLDEYG